MKTMGGMFVVAGLTLGLGACSHLPEFANLLRAKPVSTPAAMEPVGSGAAENRLYADAVKAIYARNYGQAIALLQLAREGKADDARVLTAMAVVYDKLGRFDLSDRYYAQAEKADPGSRIVAMDEKYSMILRGAAKADEAGVALAQQTTTGPVEPVRIAEVTTPETPDQLYARAVSAIEKREFGVAIGLLRQAREAAPQDVRVLTALGVTYDHLGRFDLSSRYYGQAAQVDPGSSVLAQDRRISAMLQAHGGIDAAQGMIVVASAAPGAKTPTIRKVATAAPSIRGRA